MNQISLQSQNFLAGFDPEKGTLLYGFFFCTEII